MLSPARLTQFTVELIFVLLGALVVWLGLHRRIYFDPRSVSWLVFSIGVIAWGVLAVAKPGQWWARWQTWNRGGSLILLGLLMLVIGRVPFGLVGKFLALCGVVLIVRGVVGSLLILRQR
ncbi:MAG: hypothetical protein WBR26_27215 [Candidatus Acidiferrum sp.]